MRQENTLELLGAFVDKQALYVPPEINEYLVYGTEGFIKDKTGTFFTTISCKILELTQLP